MPIWDLYENVCKSICTSSVHKRCIDRIVSKVIKQIVCSIVCADCVIVPQQIVVFIILYYKLCGRKSEIQSVFREKHWDLTFCHHNDNNFLRLIMCIIIICIVQCSKNAFLHSEKQIYLFSVVDFRAVQFKSKSK